MGKGEFSVKIDELTCGCGDLDKLVRIYVANLGREAIIYSCS